MASHRSSAKNEGQGIVRRLEAVLESRLPSADLAESLLAQFCEQAGCNEQQRNEICLAVRESVVNAVIHGNRRHRTKKVFLKAELRNSGIQVSVRDQGKGFDPKLVPDPRRPENLLRESGRGILLMRALMDRVAIRRAASNGTEVRMLKFLSKPTQEDYKMSLKATSRQADGVTILDLNGRIVLGEATALLRETVQDLITRGQKKILLNMAGVSYVDSTGLGTLVSGYTTVKNQQGELKLLNLPKKVRDLFGITKLDTVLESFEDESAAVKSFR